MPFPKMGKPFAFDFDILSIEIEIQSPELLYVMVRDIMQFRLNSYFLMKK